MRFFREAKLADFAPRIPAPAQETLTMKRSTIMRIKPCMTAVFLTIFVFFSVPTHTSALEACKLPPAELTQALEQISARKGGSFDFDLSCQAGFLQTMRLKRNGDRQESIPHMLESSPSETLAELSDVLGMQAHAGKCLLELDRVFERPSLAESLEGIQRA